MTSTRGSRAILARLASGETSVITRGLDAPRRLVFEASTKPEHLKRWWGPRYLTLVVCEVDLRAKRETLDRLEELVGAMAAC